MKQKSSKGLGLSDLIGGALMLLIVVVTASGVAYLTLGVGDSLQEPTPNVVEYSGILEEQEYYDESSDTYFNGGKITFEYHQGQNINVNDMEIYVDLQDSCETTETLINLPTKDGSGSFSDANVKSGDIASSPIDGGYSTNLGRLDSDTSNEFKPASKIKFRIASSDCELTPGDEVSASVIHEPSDSIIMNEDFTVEEYS